jgi:hypothetical protein
MAFQRFNVFGLFREQAAYKKGGIFRVGRQT